MRIPVIILLLLPTLTFAQEEAPFEQANVICVTFDSLGVTNAFNVVGRSLLDMGYSIDKADRDRFIIRTKVRTFPGSFIRAPISLIIRMSFKRLETSKTAVKLSGSFGLPDQPPSVDAAYREHKKSPFRVAFNRLQEVGKRLSGLSSSQITYASQ
jgi:hypothetical protein